MKRIEKLKSRIEDLKLQRQVCLRAMSQTDDNKVWQFWCDKDLELKRKIRKEKYEMLKIAERNYNESISL